MLIKTTQSCVCKSYNVMKGLALCLRYCEIRAFEDKRGLNAKWKCHCSWPSVWHIFFFFFFCWHNNNNPFLTLSIIDQCKESNDFFLFFSFFMDQNTLCSFNWSILRTWHICYGNVSSKQLHAHSANISMLWNTVAMCQKQL